MATLIEILVNLIPPPEDPIDNHSDPNVCVYKFNFDIHLPTDYMQYIHTYGDGRIAKFINVYNPYLAHSSHNVFFENKKQLDFLSQMRQEFPELYSIKLFPEPKGFFMWGHMVNGAYLGWETSENPEEWRVASLNDEGRKIERFGCSFLEFLINYIQYQYDDSKTLIPFSESSDFPLFWQWKSNS